MSDLTPSALTGRRLLVIEDEYLIAADLKQNLEREGAIVGIAGSVARGLELLDEIGPDAAVLDLSLGGKVSAPLAAAFTERNVPFVILTGYGESWMTFPEFHQAPVADKPVDHAVLVRLLGSALARCPNTRLV